MDREFSEVFDLRLSEKLLLLEDLWDNIASVPEAVPVPDWQKEELARRKSEHLQNPGSATSWEEAKERIRGQDD